MKKRLIIMFTITILVLFAVIYPFSLEYGQCGNELRWILNNRGIMLIYGKGHMWGNHKGDLWGEYDNRIKKVIIDEGMTGISDGAFYWCNNLKSVEIPSTVVHIGKCAFENGKNIDIQINEYNQEYHMFDGDLYDRMGSKLIQSISGKAEYKFDYGQKSIGDYAFVGCDDLVSIDMSSVNSIGEYAFLNCSSLTDIELNVENIGDYAFSGCENLKSVIIPEWVTNIGENIFEGCDNLTIYCSDENSVGYKYAVKHNIPVVVPKVERFEGKLFIDSEEVRLYRIYNVDGAVCFRLRDLAYALDGTAREFDVGSGEGVSDNIITATSYKINGSEGKPFSEERTGVGYSGVKIARNGERLYALPYETNDYKHYIAYHINGHVYFRLKDIAEIVNFGVEVDEATSTIIIDTTASYKD